MFSVPSFPGTQTPLIEPQLANARLRRRTGGLELNTIYSAEANAQNGRKMHRMRISRHPKLKHFLGEEQCLALAPDPSPSGRAIPYSIPHLHTLCSCYTSILASSALDLTPKIQIMDPPLDSSPFW